MTTIQAAFLRAAKKNKELAILINRQEAVDSVVAEKFARLDQQLELSGTNGLRGFVPCSSLNFKPGTRLLSTNPEVPCFVKWSLTNQTTEVAVVRYEAPLKIDNMLREWALLPYEHLAQDNNKHGR